MEREFMRREAMEMWERCIWEFGYGSGWDVKLVYGRQIRV